VKFLLDHDVPVEVAHLLRHWGHEAFRLNEVLAITTVDSEIFDYALEHGLLLVTCNRAHFVALAQQAHKDSRNFLGLIVLLRRRTRQAECAQMFNLLMRAGESGLSRNINFA